MKIGAYDELPEAEKKQLQQKMHHIAEAKFDLEATKSSMREIIIESCPLREF